ncbi:MAG: long-chain fatty acid--CoA ligase [Bacteroidetes bacterium]|nr:long-chain fatty acid--CoA ligase [Bacteroidota bacterium]MDA0904261.1 long-chain fatty acid--CoA ligase [Bacteroidota bacterium]MDA1243217.1 long-chain fatty acid--CoA ligase [Bacteroidota bacterium]
MKQPTRLFDFPRYQLANNPQNVMMTMPNYGNRVTYSTAQFVNEMDAVSRGLIALGMQAEDKVALISHNNRCEWNVMDHAIMQAGGIDIPIYPTMTEEDYKYILNHSESKYCFVSNEELYNKVMSVKAECPALEEVFTFEDVNGARHWTDVAKAGSDAQQAELEARRDAVDPAQLATIIYTSGTTGLPKGVMLSHDNVSSNVLVAKPRVPAVDPNLDYRVLSFLPVCHIFERMLHYLYIYMGAQIHFGESLETIKEDLNHTQPIMFTAVPRLLEKFYDGIVAKGRSAGGAKAAIFNWAVGVALDWDPNKGGLYNIKLKIARKLVFSKVKEALGLSGIQAVASGSAALQPRLARFFNGAGITVLEGYGLTETSPLVTVNTTNGEGMLKIGSVGKMADGVDVKIADDGEILVQGPNVMMGYYKDPEKTAEVLKDGWFHTGDIGVIEDGFLRITDRKKEIFKTSGGKYVAPTLLENALKASLFIEQVIVVGENQKHPAALVVPDAVVVEEWCKRHNHPFPGMAGIAGDDRLRERIEREVNELMASFAKWEQVKKITILPAVFTIDGGELTPTLKLKRKPIMAKYADAIEAMYA